MELQLVTYHQAKKLKELGCYIDTRDYYDEDGQLEYDAWYHLSDHFEKHYKNNTNVSYTATRNINKTLLTSLGIKITWLIGTYYGVKAVMDTDYINISVYLISGLIGDRLSFIVKN